MVLVKNLDIFTPIVDEPELMGEIAACNVTNDIFAMNVPKISGMLVFLAINVNTPIEIAEGILRGIKNFIETKVESKVVGGHTIYSEWPLIGGEASGFIDKDSVIYKQGVKVGDKLILTKPIGLQAIMAAYRILKEMPELLSAYSKTELLESISLATKIMTTPNQGVVRTIHSYKNFKFVHAMSDVTGFGLSGHAKEMLQNSKLSAKITRVPYIRLAKELSEELGYGFNDCSCHETAGGMLMAVDSTKVEDFSARLEREGTKNWIVGVIEKTKPGTVEIVDDVEHIEVFSL
jgi:selenide,water dikinase